jgi:CDGSH-type Zn-finger protein
MSSQPATVCTHPEELEPYFCEKCQLAKHIPHIPIYGTYNLQGKIKAGEEYNWCACGFSKEQPWCDGTCETDKPELVDENGSQKFCGYRFKANVNQTIFNICGCKYTRTPPICDGTHGPMPANPDVPPCRCALDEDKALSW